jgi:hypothetical protein
MKGKNLFEYNTQDVRFYDYYELIGAEIPVKLIRYPLNMMHYRANRITFESVSLKNTSAKYNADSIW